jgi:murein DD-endopeptidase MepM/ murein hydrolase activator NlpD
VGAKWILALAGFCLPLRHLQLTSGFGFRVHPVSHAWKFHAGIDLAARRDTVFAVLDGLVRTEGYDPRLGLTVRITHPGDLETIYGHLSQFLVLPGDTVASGDAIAITGATGAVTGEHLHFAVRYRGRPIDPLYFLSTLNFNKHENQ